jgi:hypothetical protein
MRTFTLFVFDSRSRVPIIDFIEADDENSAIKVAADKLAISDYYDAVEVFEDEVLRFRIVAANPRSERSGGIKSD